MTREEITQLAEKSAMALAEEIPPGQESSLYLAEAMMRIAVRVMFRVGFLNRKSPQEVEQVIMGSCRKMLKQQVLDQLLGAVGICDCPECRAKAKEADEFKKEIERDGATPVPPSDQVN